MKFGKLPSIEQVNFSLPPENERSAYVLGGEAAGTFRIFIGAPIWGNRDWIGKLYPKGSKAGDFLRHYSGQMSTVELNVTHYQIPTPERIGKWYSQAQQGFRFCPKIPQEISHRKLLTNCDDRLKLFCNTISGFREKLGCTFLQLPPGFGPDQLYRLEQFLGLWPSHLPLAIEFRKEEWFLHGELIPETCDLLESARVTALITDVAGRRDVSHSSITSRTAFVRFVGNNLHHTDYERIHAWTERIGNWKNQGLESLYFFIHSPNELHSPELLQYFATHLNERLGLDIHVPHLLPDGDGQLSLF